MTMTLADLAADAQNRRTQLTQLIQPPNPPSWVSFTASQGVFQVVLAPPQFINYNNSNTGSPYLLQAGGVNFPTTNSLSGVQQATFFYQVQVATDNAFTQNVQTFDMGTSPTMAIPASGSLFAQARARFANSSYSAYVPFSGSATAGSTYRPFEFSTTLANGGSVTTPYKGMDGDTSTFAAVVSSSNVGGSALVIYGPFNSTPQLTNGLTLTIITSASVVVAGDGTATVSYSVDAGSSFTTVRTSTSGWSQTTDTITLPNSFNLGLIRVEAQATNSNASSSTSINFYETFAQ